MRVLIAGDTHMYLAHLQYLINTAKSQRIPCDRVFVVGDFGFWEHIPEGVKFLDQLNLYCNVKNIHVYFLDGNHDKTSLILETYDKPETTDPEGFLLVRPYVHYARRGHRWNWDGCRFISLGGAYSIDKRERLALEKNPRYGGPESQWFPEEEMSDEDMRQILQNRDPVDVMLAHDKPRTSNPGWNRKDIMECWFNQDRLQDAMATLRPVLYIHGHLHWPYEEEVWYSHHGFTRDLAKTRVVGLDCDTFNGGREVHSWRIIDTDDWAQRGGGAG